MKPLFCRLAVLLLLWPASGLTQAGRWEGVIEIRHGVKYVHNPRKGLWDNERSHHLFAEKVFSLGSIEATDEYLFGFVQCVAVDRRGNIYASDSQRHRVQVYDQEGRYVRTIGRKGQGPGELMRPW